MNKTASILAAAALAVAALAFSGPAHAATEEYAEVSCEAVPATYAQEHEHSKAVVTPGDPGQEDVYRLTDTEYAEGLYETKGGWAAVDSETTVVQEYVAPTPETSEPVYVWGAEGTFSREWTATGNVRNGAELTPEIPARWQGNDPEGECFDGPEPGEPLVTVEVTSATDCEADLVVTTERDLAWHWTWDAELGEWVSGPGFDVIDERTSYAPVTAEDECPAVAPEPTTPEPTASETPTTAPSLAAARNAERGTLAETGADFGPAIAIGGAFALAAGLTALTLGALRRRREQA